MGAEGKNAAGEGGREGGPTEINKRSTPKGEENAQKWARFSPCFLSLGGHASNRQIFNVLLVRVLSISAMQATMLLF